MNFMKVEVPLLNYDGTNTFQCPYYFSYAGIFPGWSAILKGIGRLHDRDAKYESYTGQHLKAIEVICNAQVTHRDMPYLASNQVSASVPLGNGYLLVELLEFGEIM